MPVWPDAGRRRACSSRSVSPASMREARRKIAEGALSVYASGEERVVRDPDEKILAGESRVLRLGRRFLRVVPGS